MKTKEKDEKQFLKWTNKRKERVKRYLLLKRKRRQEKILKNPKNWTKKKRDVLRSGQSGTKSSKYFLN